MESQTVTEVFQQRIDHPSAWTRATIGGKPTLSLQITIAQRDSIDRLLERTRHLDPQQVTQRDFDDAPVNVLMRDVRDIIMDGRGSVVITGITPDRYSEAEFERIFWGLGTHLGIPAYQSVRGDRLGHVRHVPGVPGRGYLSTDELGFHADSFETVGLMCSQSAALGGFSRLVSAHALHNEILAQRPDLLAALYAGFPLGAAELVPYAPSVTRYRFPVFCNIDGIISCAYNRVLIDHGAKFSNTSLPPIFLEAINFLESTAHREDLYLEFMLEPGEMLFFNNFVVLHSRTAYENSDQLKRHYLRLWLNVPDGRPVIRAYLEQGLSYERQYRARLEHEERVGA